MGSPQSQKMVAHWDHEPRIGAFPGAEVGRLESRPSEQWFMESHYLGTARIRLAVRTKASTSDSVPMVMRK